MERRRGRGDAKRTEFETSGDVRAVTSFESMELKDDVLRGLYAYGFEKPSAIQQRALTPILEGRDCIAQAQSGTGKTSMIAVASCQLTDVKTREYVYRAWRRNAPRLDAGEAEWEDGHSRSHQEPARRE